MNLLAMLLFLLILIFLSGFFSGSEAALLTLSRARVEAMPRSKRTDMLKYLKKEQKEAIIAILIGNNIANIGGSSLATALAIDFFGDLGVGFATGIMTLIVLIAGEIIPKTFASAHAEKFALFSAPIIYYSIKIFHPLIDAFELLTSFVKKKEPIVTEKEIVDMVRIGARHRIIEEDEERLVKRVFRMNDISVSKVMVRKKNVVSLNSQLTIKEAAKKISKWPFTRYPVYRVAKDNIIGIVRSKDILANITKSGGKEKLESILWPVVNAFEEEKIDDVMKRFQKTHTYMAIVRDRKGKVVGIVTLEDILEELVGEIESEDDFVRKKLGGS